MILLSILAVLSLTIAIYNIVVAKDRQDTSYLLYLICFFIGFLFVSFEIYFIIKSFKSGTLLLHDLCLKEKTNFKRPVTLIVSSILGAIALGYFIFNVCIYAGVTSIQQSPMSVEFNMYFCLLVIINAAILISYWLFIVQEDIEISH